MGKRGGVLAVAAIVVLAAPVAPAGAQDRETTNLQVLSSELTRREVTRIMRGFTFATGYRCSDCHVGEEGQPLSEYDMAADDRLTLGQAHEIRNDTSSALAAYRRVLELDPGQTGAQRRIEALGGG